MELFTKNAMRITYHITSLDIPKFGQASPSRHICINYVPVDAIPNLSTAPCTAHDASDAFSGFLSLLPVKIYLNPLLQTQKIC